MWFKSTLRPSGRDRTVRNATQRSTLDQRSCKVFTLIHLRRFVYDLG